jgi:hypothetical protein
LHENLSKGYADQCLLLGDERTCSGLQRRAKARCDPFRLHGTPQHIPPTPPAQGTTPAQIDADFPAYIIWQFIAAPAGGMENTITSMTDKELYMLASFFIQDQGINRHCNNWPPNPWGRQTWFDGKPLSVKPS